MGDDVSLNELMNQRNQDIELGHNSTEMEMERQHTAQSIRESLTRWFKQEGISLAGDQMMRLNEYFLPPNDDKKIAGNTNVMQSAWEKHDDEEEEDKNQEDKVQISEDILPEVIMSNLQTIETKQVPTTQQ